MHVSTATTVFCMSTALLVLTTAKPVVDRKTAIEDGTILTVQVISTSLNETYELEVRDVRSG